MKFQSKVDIDDNELCRLICIFASERARNPNFKAIGLPFGQEHQYIITIDVKTIEKLIPKLRKEGYDMSQWDLPVETLKKINIRP